MKLRKMASSFSNREQRRRTPFSRRNSRSTSLCRLDSSRSSAQGASRVVRGGPTGSPQGPGKRAGLVPLRGPVQHHRQRRSLAAQATKPLAALGRSMGLAGGQQNRHRGSSIRG